MIYIALAVLVIFSAFFSSLETGLLALGHVRTKKWLKSILPELKTWIEDPSQIITAILIGNNLVNISFSAIFTVVIVHFAEIRDIPESWVEIVSIFCSSFIILFLGEIIPKIFANTYPDRVVSNFYRPFNYFFRFIKPIVEFLNIISFSMVGPLKIKKEKIISRKELYLALKETAHSGKSSKYSAHMLGRVLSLSEKTVSEIMIPRKQVAAIDIGWEYERIIEYLMKSPYSRLPAYVETIDNLKGFIYVKDVIASLHNNDTVDFYKILRPAHITYPGRNCQHIFHEMRLKHSHCSVVISNKRVIGLVTIEDIIEEIVGEIYDEYDFRNAAV